jgi:hypothetical protein
MLAPAASDPVREAKQMRTVMWVVALALRARPPAAS